LQHKWKKISTFKILPMMLLFHSKVNIMMEELLNLILKMLL